MTTSLFSLKEFENLYIAILPVLRHISCHTDGEFTVDDLKNEAWLLAVDLYEKRTDMPISSPSFQKLISAHLFSRLCKYTSKTTRYAVRLDDMNDNADDNSKNRWLESLTATSENDPISKLCRIEEMQEQEKQLQFNYSEAVAYYSFLENFKKDRQAIAEHLALSWRWIWYKIKRARYWMQQQSSLFDGIEIIEEDFMPPHCQRKRKKPFSHSEYVLLEKEWKRLQQKLFTLAYIPIKADIEALPLKNTSDPIS